MCVTPVKFELLKTWKFPPNPEKDLKSKFPIKLQLPALYDVKIFGDKLCVTPVKFELLDTTKEPPNLSIDTSRFPLKPQAFAL